MKNERSPSENEVNSEKSKVTGRDLIEWHLKAKVWPQEPSGDLGRVQLVEWQSQDKPLEVAWSKVIPMPVLHCRILFSPVPECAGGPFCCPLHIL